MQRFRDTESPWRLLKVILLPDLRTPPYRTHAVLRTGERQASTRTSGL